MKSEKEFLDEMWDTVSKIEYDEQQKELARNANRQMKKIQWISYGLFSVVFFLLYNIALEYTLSLYVFCILALLLGYIAEFLSAHKTRRSY